VAALGEEGNAVLQRALADEWSSGDELAQQLAAAAGEAEPVALASGGSATLLPGLPVFDCIGGEMTAEDLITRLGKSPRKK